MMIAVAGPTASGKSALGLTLAQRLGGEILCADSRQIYQGFDIGTATPSAEEQQQVPHHLFDIADPRQTFTLSEYVDQAEACLQSLQQQGRLAILVGGTGLYFRSLLYAYQLPKVAPQPELREALQSWSLEELYQEVKRVDPESAQRIHPNDQRRLIRALEVYRSTDQPLTAWQQRSQGLARKVLYVGLRPAQAFLYEQIQKRIEVMLESGLVQEVEQLRQRYGADLPLLQTLNYTEIAAYLDGQWELETAKTQMFIHTRQYAKRQLTWFRRDQELLWFDLQTPEQVDAIAEQVVSLYQERQAYV